MSLICDGLETFLGGFLIYPYILSLSWNTYLIVYYMLIFIIVATIMLMFYVSLA